MNTPPDDLFKRDRDRFDRHLFHHCVVPSARMLLVCARLIRTLGFCRTIMDMNKESQTATLLLPEIYAPSGEEMLSKAIAITLQTPTQDRAVLFELLMKEIVAITSEPNSGMKPWTCFVHTGTDGSRIFRGGIGTSIVIDPEGRLWRARTYEDFETIHTITATSCEIATMKPNYSLMREYVIH